MTDSATSRIVFSGSMPLADAIDWFTADSLGALCRSPNTKRAYRSDLRSLARLVSDAAPLDAITQPVVTRWLGAGGAGVRLSTSTRRRRAAALRAFARAATLAGAASMGALVDGLPHLPRPRALPRSLSDIEASTLLRYVREFEATCRWSLGAGRIDHARCTARLITEVMLATGVRVGELVRITRNDIYDAGRRIIIHGKGSRQRSVHVVDAGVSAALSHHLELHAAHSADARLVVPFGRHSASEAYVRRVVSSTARAAGVARHVTPHVLRHTAATMLLRAGANLRVVQTLLGHSTIAMTERYTHVSGEHLEEAMQHADHIAKSLARMPVAVEAVVGTQRMC